MNAKKLKTKKPKAYSWCHKRVLEFYDCGVPDFNSLDDDIISLYNFVEQRQDEWDEYIRLKIKLVLKWANPGAKLQLADELNDVFKQFNRLYKHAKLRAPWAVPDKLQNHHTEYVTTLIPDDYVPVSLKYEQAQD